VLTALPSRGIGKVDEAALRTLVSPDGAAPDGGPAASS
jgi:hypothetical protein